MTADKVIRIQGDKLATLLNLPKKTYFELSELETLANTPMDVRSITFRGKKVDFTPSVKTIAGILIEKIKK
jgi:hypothetical protein